jgi:hypothetical protein
MQQHSLMPAEFFQKLELTAGSKKTHLRAISGSDSEAKTGEIYNVSPRKIVVIKGLNARIKDQAYWEGDDEKGLEGIMHLAKSIKRDGFKKHKPLAGYVAEVDGEDVLFLTEGHRRLDAALYYMDNLGGPADFLVPVVAEAKEMTALELNYSLRQSNTGQPFRPIEDLMWVLRMLDTYGQSEAMLRTQSGIKESLLRSMIIVGRGPTEILELVKDEKVSITVAGDTITKYGPEKAVEVLVKAKAVAEASGRERITPRFMADAKFEKQLTKKSTTMYDLVAKVRQDQAYSALSHDTREGIENMMAELEILRHNLAKQEAKALEKAARQEQLDEAEKGFETNPNSDDSAA